MNIQLITIGENNTFIKVNNKTIEFKYNNINKNKIIEWFREKEKRE